MVWSGRAYRVILSLLLSGCAFADRSAIYTEQGLEAAAEVWHIRFMDILARCQLAHDAGTPGAQQCFGPTAEADDKVRLALESSVALLRSYWRARAVGKEPDLREVVSQISALLKDLPPEARQILDKVQGL